jgi:hypothetical protein
LLQAYIMDLVTNCVVITGAIRFVQQSLGRLKASKDEKKEKLILYPSHKKEHAKEPKKHDYNDKDANWNGNKKKR